MAAKSVVRRIDCTLNCRTFAGYKRLFVGMGLRLRHAGTIFFATVLGLSVIVSAQTASTQPAGRNPAGGGESRSAERGNRSRGQNLTATQMQRIQDALQAT